MKFKFFFDYRTSICCLYSSVTVCVKENKFRRLLLVLWLRRFLRLIRPIILRKLLPIFDSDFARWY